MERGRERSAVSRLYLGCISAVSRLGAKVVLSAEVLEAKELLALDAVLKDQDGGQDSEGEFAHEEGRLWQSAESLLH